MQRTTNLKYDQVLKSLQQVFREHAGPQEFCPPSNVWVIAKALQELLQTATTDSWIEETRRTEMVVDNKPIIALDFDGVIHSYEDGWQNGHIYGIVVPGFFEWAEKAKEKFNLCIFSSRSASHKTRQPMEDWLKVQLTNWLWDNPESKLQFPDFSFAAYKPPAYITIDDRALTFKGNWSDPIFDPDELITFKSWVSKG